jgi:hypothetical protein
MRREYDTIFRALLNMESVIGLTQTDRAHHTEGVSSPCKAFWYRWLCSYNFLCPHGPCHHRRCGIYDQRSSQEAPPKTVFLNTTNLLDKARECVCVWEGEGSGRGELHR